MVDLAPSAAVKLINSAGGDLTSRRLYDHRQLAGLGDGKTVDLLRYAGWLFDRRHGGTPTNTEDAYERRKEAARSRQAAMARAGRDIGPLPEVKDPKRKEACGKSLRQFLETYLSQTFYMGWSDDHLRAIHKMEQAIIHGGLFALAMPRGFGKSSLSEGASSWALLYGYRRFIMLIGSNEESAEEMLTSIKTEIEVNDLLAEDFPEVCYPVRRLEGIMNRANGQILDGKRTMISWNADEIILPTIEGSPSSGGIIRVAGILGRVRGQKFKRQDGETVRPDLVIPDDPQTDESARSVSQSRQRARILAGAVIGLAGPGKKISGVMPCTVIAQGDMVDRILDKDLHPEWNGERTKIIYEFPTNKELWERYSEIRSDSLRRFGTIKLATEFYKKNRQAMDEGARVAWDDRFNPDELSAVQNCMNLRLMDEDSFWSEYQNDPRCEEDEGDHTLTADEIAAKVNGFTRGLVPNDAQRITAFIDVQDALLYFVVCAWADDFTGYVIDYGAYPDQKSNYFTLREAQKGNATLIKVAKGSAQEGAWMAGLKALVDDLFGTKWQRDDGTWAAIDRMMIDANYGKSTEVVYSFCRESDHSAKLIPSHGQFVGASHKPFSEYAKKRGERMGHNWRMPPPKGKGIRYVLYDTNYWKTFVHDRMAMVHGDRGSLSLFKASPSQHRMFAEQNAAEYRVKTQGRGRTVDEWKLPPSKPDNHLKDCVIGCAVAASVAGVVIPDGGKQQPTKAKRKRISLSEIREQKRRGNS